ncbi:hypothetical protein ACB092_11G241300 [Castanea dentata]
MAEGVLFDVAARIIEKTGVKDEIVRLGERVSTIKAVLLDAEKKEQTNQMSNKVCIYFSESNPHAYALKMAHEVKAMMERLDTIGRDRELFHFEEHLEETQVRNRARETHSFVCAETVIGRENDKRAIIGILLDSNVEENVSILPIVGIGGLGKTTLAQLVFNDEKIKKHFDQKFWVCVSDDFEVRVIVEKIIILVLDDVWNDNCQKWLNLKNLLMGGAKGSRILVTTREEKVAKIVQPMQQYILKGLNVDDAWILFKQMAFKNGQEPKNPTIKSIGMEIIENCRGVPLPIRSIGSLLYFKNSERDWLSFKNNDFLKEVDTLQTLKLSYDHLPSYIKQCFAYCCLFPKDYEIHKTTLFKMWMAQGFIRSSSPNQCLEDIGHGYFMDLLWRSFFQDHDLMHDLAKLVAASDIATFYSKEEGIHEKTRHVSFDRMFLSSLKIPVSLYKASRIRTFHLPNKSRYSYAILDKSTCNAIVSSFKFIRLLDLHEMRIETIPSSIGKLRHLRYLDLSNTSIKILPNSITRLHNLQTLRFTGCHRIKELPKDINKLLTKLRTLSQFVISKDTCFAFRRNSRLKELYKLNELRGTLVIRGLRHGKDAALESKDANMKEKQCLQGLTLRWIKENDMDESNVGYGGVKFPSVISSLSNLVNLSLDVCNKCQHLPPLDQFHSLKTLFLEQMYDLEYISERENNGEFSGSSFLPSLEQLRIEYCPNRKGTWQRDSVEDFHNHSLPSFPHLSYLHIWECPKLICLPLFPNLEKLELGKCSLKPLEQTLRMEVINTATLENLTSIAATSTFSSSILAASSFIPFSKLNSILRNLGFYNLPNLATLPVGIQHLTSLQRLWIENCPSLSAIPEWICNLTSLQKLGILRGPILSKRCEREEIERVGAWQKWAISHNCSRM